MHRKVQNKGNRNVAHFNKRLSQGGKFLPHYAVMYSKNPVNSVKVCFLAVSLWLAAKFLYIAKHSKQMFAFFYNI